MMDDFERQNSSAKLGSFFSRKDRIVRFAPVDLAMSEYFGGLWNASFGRCSKHLGKSEISQGMGMVPLVLPKLYTWVFNQVTIHFC